VKGIRWKEQKLKQPIMALFSFCTNIQCVVEGTKRDLTSNRTIFYPPFQFQIGIPVGIEQILSTKENLLRLLKEQNVTLTVRPPIAWP